MARELTEVHNEDSSGCFDTRAFQVVKNLPANSGDLGDTGLSPGLGRFPGGGNGNSLKYFCLEIPMDRGAWQTVVHGAVKSQT